MVTEHCEPRHRRQSEVLFPALESLLKAHGSTWQDIASLGVCTGPGFFNGIRVAIAAARGLALSLKIPAVGVDRFAALSMDIPGPTLAILTMPDGQPLCRMTNETDAFFATPATIKDHCPVRCTVVGHDATAYAAEIQGRAAAALYKTSTAAALAAHRRLGQASPRPVPYYVNPPRVDPRARRFAQPAHIKKAI